MDSIIRGLILSCVIGFLVSCSLEPASKNRKIFIQIDGQEQNSSSLADALLNPLSQHSPGPAPSVLSGFDCFGVNVTGPGIPDSSTNPQPNIGGVFDALMNRTSYCSYRGILAGPVYLGATPQDIAMVVPPGLRLIQIVGLKERNGSNDCISEFNQGIPRGIGPSGVPAEADVFEVGRAALNLAGADASVAIPIDWVALAQSERDFRYLKCNDGTTTAPPPPLLHVTTPTVPAGIGSVSSISMGAHTCVVQSGAVMCKGSGNYGQLGSGTVVTSSSTFVTAVASGASAVAVGTDFTCAIVSGTLKCWGHNQYGQLGNNTTTDSSSPVAVNIMGTISSVVVGDGHACAISNNPAAGSLWCWGKNTNGQVGDSTTTNRLTPVQLTGFVATQIAAGMDHSCAIMSGMNVYCWGKGANGQIGNGSATDQLIPVNVSAVTGAASIALGANHSCAITSGAKCWGANAYGQVGDNTTMDKLTPTTVVGGSGFTAISAGAAHTCGSNTGSVMCWGANTSGQLGNGGTAGANTPVAISGSVSGNMGTVTSPVASGTCVIYSGSAQCFGANDYGEIVPP